MVNNTVYEFVGSDLGVEKFFKRGNIRKKRCVEIEDWDFSVHFVLGFQENSIYTLRLCFTFYVKTDSCFQKSHEEFGQLETSIGKSKKLKFDGLLSSKNKFVQKIHSFS